MTPERLASLIAAKGISVGHIRGGGRPEWTAAEAAMALGGMEPAEERAQCYAAFVHRWAGDDSQRHVLVGYLFVEADRMALRERWPSRVREQRYLERLCRMAVLEERHWWVINQHRLWPAILADDGFRDIDEDLWFRRLSRKYEAIRHVIESWCSTAHYHMLNRIQGEYGS